MATPRKAAAKRAPRRLAATSDTPSPISMNLDTLEREGTPDPYVIVFGGERYQMADAMELDWNDLAKAQENPVQFMAMVIPKHQQKTFFANRLPVWKINKLMDAYMAHHGMTAPGELDALST